MAMNNADRALLALLELEAKGAEDGLMAKEVCDLAGANVAGHLSDLRKRGLVTCATVQGLNRWFLTTAGEAHAVRLAAAEVAA